MKCDVCEFEMTDEKNKKVKTLMAIEINFDDMSHPVVKKVKETYGKTDFAICCVCFLKSLGVKPLEDK